MSSCLINQVGLWSLCIAVAELPHALTLLGGQVEAEVEVEVRRSMLDICGGHEKKQWEWEVWSGGSPRVFKFPTLPQESGQLWGGAPSQT